MLGRTSTSPSGSTATPKEGADALKAKVERGEDKNILCSCDILGQFWCLHTASSWELRAGDTQSLSEGSGFKI